MSSDKEMLATSTSPQDSLTDENPHEQKESSTHSEQNNSNRNSKNNCQSPLLDGPTSRIPGTRKSTRQTAKRMQQQQQQEQERAADRSKESRKTGGVEEKEEERAGSRVIEMTRVVTHPLELLSPCDQSSSSSEDFSIATTTSTLTVTSASQQQQQQQVMDVYESVKASSKVIDFYKVPVHMHFQFASSLEMIQKRGEQERKKKEEEEKPSPEEEGTNTATVVTPVGEDNLNRKLPAIVQKRAPKPPILRMSSGREIIDLTGSDGNNDEDSNFDGYKHDPLSRCKKRPFSERDDASSSPECSRNYTSAPPQPPSSRYPSKIRQSRTSENRDVESDREFKMSFRCVGDDRQSDRHGAGVIATRDILTVGKKFIDRNVIHHTGLPPQGWVGGPGKYIKTAGGYFQVTHCSSFYVNEPRNGRVANIEYKTVYCKRRNVPQLAWKVIRPIRKHDEILAVYNQKDRKKMKKKKRWK